MTVAWIDTPGVPLYSASEAIDFTATDEVSALSVSFGPNRVEERAFRDGAFLYPYLASTRDGTTFALRRSGGWPRTPTVFVDEVPPVPPLPTGGQAYGAIYNLDFAAQPSQNLTPKSTYTIDGLTWYAKNNPGTSNISIVNGSGLNFWSVEGSPPTSRIMCLPLASVPGFNATAPLQVWCHMVSLDSGHGSPCFGLVDVAADLTDYNSSMVAGTYMISYASGANTNYTVFRPDVNLGFTGPARPSAGATTALGIAALNKSMDYGIIATDYAGGSLPAADPWNYPTVWQAYTRPSFVRTRPTLAIQANFFGNYNIKKLSILQPRLAA